MPSKTTMLIGGGVIVVLLLAVWWWMRSSANAQPPAELGAGGAPTGATAVRQRAQALAGAIAAPGDVKGEPNRP